MTDAEAAEYFAAHEHLALLAIEASDKGSDPDIMAEIVERAPDTALLLTLAIALAEDRALRGDAPEGPPVDITAEEHNRVMNKIMEQRFGDEQPDSENLS